MDHCYTCRKCGLEKPIQEFYIRRGKVAKPCRACNQQTCKKHHVKMMSSPELYHQYRERHRAKVARYKAAGTLKPSSLSPNSKRSKAEWAARNRFKSNVEKKANRAKLRGIIKSPETCQHCDKKVKLQMHHTDYSKPLDVIWLCTACHGVAHRKPIFPQDYTRKDRTTTKSESANEQ